MTTTDDVALALEAAQRYESLLPEGAYGAEAECVVLAKEIARLRAEVRLSMHGTGECFGGGSHNFTHCDDCGALWSPGDE